MNKNIIIGALLIVIAGGAYYAYTSKAPAASQEAMTGQPTGGKHAISWKFESAGEQAETSAPLSKVTVTWDGVSHDAGTYAGQCHEIDGSGGMALAENQVSGAFCYWAGYGDEVGVFKEGSGFVLKHGEYQEPSAESPSFRGNFTTLITL